MRRLSLLIVFFFLRGGVYSADLYVWTNSPHPGAPYNAWSNAARILQDAADHATGGDTIWVTNGVYDAGGVPGVGGSNRCALSTAVSLIGINGPSNTIIKGAGPMGAAGMRCLSLGAGGTVSGFTITNGYNSGIYSYGPLLLTNCVITGNHAVDYGGGVRCDEDAVIVNCRFVGNTTTNVFGQGGGFWVNGSVRISDCEFIGNASRGSGSHGGGAAAWSAEVARCTFTDNRAEDGGGLWVECDVVVSGTVFISNTADEDGGGLFARNDAVLYNCDFISNCATDTMARGGGACVDDHAVVSNCTFASNWVIEASGSGGGLYMQRSDISHSTATFNRAQSGAAFCTRFEGAIRKCLLTDNTATAIYSKGSAACFESRDGFVDDCGWLTRNRAYYGGAIYGARVTNCFFKANTGYNGGAVSDCSLYNCTFVSNWVQSWGGAMFVGGTCVTVDTCDISWNVADGSVSLYGVDFIGDGIAHGGGVAGPVDIRNSRICDNVVTGGIAEGGGLYKPAHVQNCIITNNRALGNIADGGGLNDPRWTVSNCLISANYASSRGGGLDSGNGLGLVVDRCQIIDNASEQGGGVYIFHGNDVIFRNTLFTGNRVDGTFPRGGGLYIFNFDTYIQNCTFVDNSSTEAFGGMGGFHPGGKVQNCIIYGNTAPVYPDTHAYISDYHNTCCDTTNLSGVGNFRANPQFVSAATRDYHLSSSSPCIDAGMDIPEINYDLDGIGRPLDGDDNGSNIHDVGAYEYGHPSADSDGDGLLDVDEINTYGTNPYDSDTDDDGLSDYEEVITWDTDPFDADTDDDGLSDGEEVNTYGTNPEEPDHDHDGLSDGDEVYIYGTLPTDPDTDGDEMNDGDEVAVGRDPLDPNDYIGLGSGHVDPAVGSTNTLFRFEVGYWNTTGYAPSTNQVFIDGTPYDMTLDSGTETNGIWAYESTFSPGEYEYHFYFVSATGDVLRLPETGPQGAIIVYENVYAAPNGPHIPPFNAWDRAASNIQAAIDSAPANCALMLSNGTYRPSTTIVITNAVTVIGAFGRESTIIDGSSGTGICVVLDHPEAMLRALTVTHAPDSGVYCLDGHLADCTISSNAVLFGNGGGIRFEGDAWLTNCTLLGNSAWTGGGIYAPARACITNCLFVDNEANEGGGAWFGGNSVVVDCDVLSNRANRGGGFSATSGLTAAGCLFRGNEGTGVKHGAGLYVKDATVTNCSFDANNASQGSAIYAMETLIVDTCFEKNGGGSVIQGVSNVVVDACSFYLNTGSVRNVSGLITNCAVSNSAGSISVSGGAVDTCRITLNTSGLLCEQGAIVRNCVFRDNSSLNGAGATCLSGGEIRLCVIEGNQAILNGGGVYIDTGGLVENCRIIENSGSSGGGAYLGNSGGYLQNCLVAGNRSPGSGAGVCQIEGDVSGCTIVDNHGGGFGGGFSGRPTSVVNNCIIYYNTGFIGADIGQGIPQWCCVGVATNGTNNITSPPLISSMRNPHLMAVSPCIDAGTNIYASGGFDLDGDFRTNGVSVDIGCDEYVASTVTGMLNVTMWTEYPRAIEDIPIGFTFEIEGKAKGFVWAWDDGSTTANDPAPTHRYSNEGGYAVTLTVSNADHSVTVTSRINIISGFTTYAAPGGKHFFPFESWGAAATNIQDAI
ncbi:MAG: PKD domain-containing protein, partial [Spartobacteria bacterium]|nr:PKD domain-containing protein [Spartobacteria bacterium]